jgi:hypothetical protein
MAVPEFFLKDIWRFFAVQSVLRFSNNHFTDFSNLFHYFERHTLKEIYAVQG